MKKLLFSLSFLLFTLSGSSQIINHPQSFDGYGWGEIDVTTIVLSTEKHSKLYISIYDRSNANYAPFTTTELIKSIDKGIIGSVWQ